MPRALLADWRSWAISAIASSSSSSRFTTAKPFVDTWVVPRRSPAIWLAASTCSGAEARRWTLDRQVKFEGPLRLGARRRVEHAELLDKMVALDEGVAMAAGKGRRIGGLGRWVGRVRTTPCCARSTSRREGCRRRVTQVVLERGWSGRGRRRAEGATTPGRRRSDGGTAAPPGCGCGCGRASAGTAPVTNFAKPEISDRGRDAVRGAMIGRDRARDRLVTKRPGVW